MILMDFGGVIKGDSTIKDHDGWISVGSFSLGVGRAINTTGGGKDRDTSTPSFQEAQVTKVSDIASTELFAQAAYGKKICDKAVVQFLQTGGEDAGQVFAEWELYEPIISSFSVSSGGERATESISISFTKIVQKFTQFEEGGKQTQADPKGYDLLAGKAFSG